MTLSIEEMATFCKKKGFVYADSEIYGGMAGFWDFGHLGSELKNNIKQDWWKTFVLQREDVVGIDGTIITNPKVWIASGHAENFADVMLECPKCKLVIKGDVELDKCEKCGEVLKKKDTFNLMFETNVGASRTKESTAYLRPETAQLIFTNFRLVQEHARLKLPFGIAQIGKAFRNEISPRDFLFRSREFEQMEIEYFVHPDRLDDCPFLKEVSKLKVNLLTEEMQKKKKEHVEITIADMAKKKLATEWHAYWLAQNYKWFLSLGINKENLRFREHYQGELAHYAKACFDIEYKFPFGWKEIHGNADRKQFDLQQHMKHSGVDMGLFDEETKQKVVPYVASEPSQGVDRAFLAFMFDAYNDDKKRGNIVLKLHPKLAPIKAGVFPLVNKLNNETKKIYDGLKTEFSCQFDKSGSVGRRYARADESGVVYCVTFDFDSLNDKAVTIRDRETTKQIRVKIDKLKEVLSGLLNGNIKFEEAGKLVK